ncbi:hypothetical protein [Zavarzinella formosa]|uniref:hypothetical protein n=1 Tax=Zavarzinella formosa TaxID=360055 RepID=UPI0002DB83A6|nr:hypothetical protein [Zavarzinella formosa]
MNRSLIGAGIGAVAGLLALGSVGAWGGYNYGSEWVGRPNVVPGIPAAVEGAAIILVYFWWLGLFVGGMMGGLAGFGSWLVRPKPTRDRSAMLRT